MSLDCSVVISFLAIIVSVVNACYTYFQSESHNKINIRSKYFEKVFDEHLLVNLPTARRYLRFSDGRLVDVEKLSDALNDLRQSAVYFMYANHKFYDELRDYIGQLDDYIQECGNKRYDFDQQSIVLDSIQKKMESIYDCIDKASTGRW